MTNSFEKLKNIGNEDFETVFKHHTVSKNGLKLIINNITDYTKDSHTVSKWEINSIKYNNVDHNITKYIHEIEESVENIKYIYGAFTHRYNHIDTVMHIIAQTKNDKFILLTFDDGINPIFDYCITDNWNYFWNKVISESEQRYILYTNSYTTEEDLVGIHFDLNKCEFNNVITYTKLYNAC